jgi:hypothetical protein
MEGGQEFVIGGNAGEGAGLISYVIVERPGEVIAALIAVVRCVEGQESAGVTDERGAQHKAADHGKDVELAAMPSAIERTTVKTSRALGKASGSCGSGPAAKVPSFSSAPPSSTATWAGLFPI